MRKTFLAASAACILAAASLPAQAGANGRGLLDTPPGVGIETLAKMNPVLSCDIESAVVTNVSIAELPEFVVVTCTMPDGRLAGTWVVKASHPVSQNGIREQAAVLAYWAQFAGEKKKCTTDWPASFLPICSSDQPTSRIPVVLYF